MTNNGRLAMSELPGARCARRGAAMIIVLVLLAMTMVVSYAMLQSSSTAAQIQSNGNRNERARLAAMAGISAALRAMHNTSAWGGVNTTLSGSLSTLDSYSVSYATGDSSLTISDPDYAQWPYRVTLLSTGTAVDATNAALQSTHQIRVVVQLVRQQLASQPASWVSITPFTVYQSHHSKPVTIEVPCRVTGAVRLHGDLNLCQDYPDGSSRSIFTTDLGLMPGAGGADYRPFGGPVSLLSGQQTGDDATVLATNMQTSTTLITSQGPSLPSLVANLTSYQLYAGGPSYTIGAVGSSLSNTTLTPNPQTNPLGIYGRAGNITVGSNVNVQGTLISTNRITVSGSGVSFSSYDQAPLAGTSSTVRLPTVYCYDLDVTTAATCNVGGLVFASNMLRYAKGTTNGTLTITGKIMCDDLRLEGRSDWDNGLFWWNLALSIFNTQKDNGIPYYPAYLVTLPGLSLTPRCTIAPDATAVTYHGQALNTPVYVPATGATGLKWDVVSWADVE